MFKLRNLLFCSLLIIVLCPVIFFPVSHDLAVFIQGGRVVAEGGTLYKDFVDIKPPVLYYILAAFHKTIGTSVLTIRFIDFLYQAATALFLFTLMKKSGLSDLSAKGAAVVYAMSYVILAYGNTTQVESVAGLPVLAAIYIRLFRFDKISLSILQGFLLGLITSLKFTYAVVLAVFIIELFISCSFKASLKRSVLIISGFVLALVLCFLPLANPEIRDGYSHVMQYLNTYSGSITLSQEYIKELIRHFAGFFSEYYSLLLIIFISTGAYIIIKNGREKERDLFEISFFITIALVLTIIREDKYFPYHLSRVYILLSIPAGVGLDYILRALIESWRTRRIQSRLVVLSVILLAALFSPLPRLAKQLTIPYKYLTNYDQYIGMYYFPDTEPFIKLSDQLEIVKMIKSDVKENDKAIIVSTCSGTFYYYFDTFGMGSIPNSYYYLGNLVYPYWLGVVEKEMESARYVILHLNDYYPLFYGNISTSELFLKHPVFGRLLEEKYEKIKRIGVYDIYKRRSV